MVDFNNNQTVTTAPKDLLNIMILESRFNLKEAIESYKRNKLKNNIDSIDEIKARLYSLYFEVQAPLELSLDKKDYEKFVQDIDSEDFDVVFKACIFLNKWLYGKGLIKFDINKIYDGTNPEEENEVNGIN